MIANVVRKKRTVLSSSRLSFRLKRTSTDLQGPTHQVSSSLAAGRLDTRMPNAGDVSLTSSADINGYGQLQRSAVVSGPSVHGWSSAGGVSTELLMRVSSSPGRHVLDGLRDRGPGELSNCWLFAGFMEWPDVRAVDELYVRLP